MSSSTRQFDRGERPRQPTTVYFPQLGQELTALRDEALAAMAADWEAGRRTAAETVLERYPQLAGDEQAAVQIVYEEICLREEHGDLVRSSEIHRRFPQWRRAIDLLLECHHLVQEDEAVANFPVAGQSLGELQLVYKLGQGAAGRVYLATQPSLSDRPLVVKLTPRRGDEHLSLARLQHTHIAPLYHVQDFPERKLRAIYMPYLGGTSWAALLEALKDRPPARRTGRAIVEALDHAQSKLPLEPNRSGPALHFLARSSYVQAVCWIGACLADALHYAHQRGLVHLDVKPSNVLIGGDGQPMLLDFHLAREVVPANCPTLDQLGGTRNYMSPEQRAAAAALGDGGRNPEALDGRSDVYSLGVMLYESLSGRLPAADEAESRSTLARQNPAVGPGLADVLHKCLARQPAARYREAAQLATDLRCALADLPLQGVPNRSLSERWHKWRRRKPHALPAGAAIATAVAVVGIAALLFHTERVSAARSALDLGERSLAERDFATAADQLENGSRALGWIPGQRDLKHQLQARLSEARRGRLAGAVHQLVEQLRYLDSAESVSVDTLRRLDTACAALWQTREKIAELGALEPNTPGEQDLRADLTDLAISWAALRERLDGSLTSDETARATGRLFDEAEALGGDSFSLELARRAHAADRSGQGAADSPDELPRAITARDHVSLGRHLLRSNQPRAAASQFERAIAREPNAFWPYFYLTLSAYRLDDFDRAMNAASVCVALSPRSAPCFYNRAMCQQALGHEHAALADLSRAVQLDPTMGVAWLRRGMLHADARQYAEAIADYARALQNGSDPAETRYQLAVAEAARGRRQVALEHVNAALAHDQAYAPAVTLKQQLDSRP